MEAMNSSSSLKQGVPQKLVIKLPISSKSLEKVSEGPKAVQSRESSPSLKQAPSQKPTDSSIEEPISETRFVHYDPSSASKKSSLSQDAEKTPGRLRMTTYSTILTNWSTSADAISSTDGASSPIVPKRGTKRSAKRRMAMPVT